MPIAIPHLISAGICFAVAMSGLAFSNILILAMVGDINRKSSDDSQESYFGYYPQKMVRVFVKYKRFYPSGKLHLYAGLSFSVMVVGMIGVAVSLGIIG
jgi:hypothetical protein